ncbi:MAG: glycosyltransferase family 4 protein [Candidatus Eisenbacteria bacterium]|nr:glycosyltransferase family 4 protein [Candidatus Eisenbacteria bacterium]MCC7143123.1 glycosyltransferase family 4 protein [Candidatus Eisenbacteria bacterium]
MSGAETLSPPLRVTLYSDALYFGGAEMYLALLAEHLDRERFTLTAVLPPDPGAERLRALLTAQGVRVHELERPGFSWLPRLPRMVRRFRAVGGDVLHLNLPSSYDAGVSSVAWAAREAGYARVVSTEHLPMIERKYRKFPTKVFFSHWIDRIIVMTRQNRDFLVDLHGMDFEKIRIIDNGVNAAAPFSAEERAARRSSWGVGSDDLVVGNVAALTRRKGQHLLLEACAQLRDHQPAWRLVIIGEGEERTQLESQARQLGISDRLCLAGPAADAARAMHAFDLFVLPSLVESMPLTLLEAMAAGLPCVGSAVFGVPEVIDPEQTGLLVPAGDTAGLARALGRLLSDPDLRARFGRAGRERFDRRFRADAMSARVADLYRDVEPAQLGGAR